MEIWKTTTLQNNEFGVVTKGKMCKVSVCEVRIDVDIRQGRYEKYICKKIVEVDNCFEN